MQAKIQAHGNAKIHPLDRPGSVSLTSSIYKLDKTSLYLRKQHEPGPTTPKHHSFLESTRNQLNLNLIQKEQLVAAGKQVVGVVRKKVQNLGPVLGKKRALAHQKKKSSKSSENAQVFLQQPTSSMMSTKSSWTEASQPRGSTKFNKNPLGYFAGENQFVFFHNTYQSQLKDLKKRKWIPNSLQFHKISEVMRNRMLDWMLEVMNTFECSLQTYFLSVSIFDRFLDAYAQQKKILEDSDVHLIGVCCMFIANKFEEPKILKIEQEILQTLQFDLNCSNPYQVLKLYLGSLAHTAQSLGFNDQLCKQLLNRIKCLSTSVLQYAQYYMKNMSIGPLILAYISITASIRYCKHKPGLDKEKERRCKKEFSGFLKRMYKEASGACLLPLSKYIDQSEQDVYEDLIKLCSSSKGKSTFIKYQMVRLAKQML